jgi:Ca-activated chloride channel family protein
MRFLKAIPAVFIIFCFAPLSAQETEQVIKAGNEHYKKGDYPKAETEYRKASTDARAKFNHASSLYKQDKITEAAAGFDEIISTENKTGLRSSSYYNKGVILSGQKKTEESIEAYKNTLRLNPDDKQARENLQKALLELKRKTPPKKEDKKKSPPKTPPPKPNPKQTQQQLKKLEQKEKETREKQQQKKTGNALPKDW